MHSADIIFVSVMTHHFSCVTMLLTGDFVLAQLQVRCLLDWPRPKANTTALDL